MKLSFRPVVTMASVMAIAGAALLIPMTASAEGSSAEEGKIIAFDSNQGNCLSCHVIADGEMPGNIGPPLIAMQARFPDRAKLRAQIADSTAANPNSMMPPFLKHGILTEAELEKVVDFVQTL